MSKKESRKGSRMGSRKNLASRQNIPVEKATMANPDYSGQSIFKFKNGDIYIGKFAVVFPDQVTKHGYGLYICADNTAYLGTWDEDQFTQGVIRYKDGVTYKGALEQSQYEKMGCYTIPGLGDIIALFSANKPSTKNMILQDVNGFCWKLETKQKQAWFYPYNPYITKAQCSLNKPRGKSKTRLKSRSSNRSRVHTT